MNTLNVTNDKKSGVSLKVHLIFYVLDKYVGKMWDTGVVETHVISLVWPCNTPFSRRMDILLPCNLKEAVQKRSVTPCSLHPPCVYLACLVREQLHRILPLTTAHAPFDTWRKSFYNRPSDCCFMLCLLCRTAYAYHIRLAHPRALEWLPWQLYYTTVQSAV